MSPYPARPLTFRFAAKYAVDDSGCWLWTAARNRGYGVISDDDGRQIGAHRASWLVHFGDPGDKQVLHRCDVRNCVNPMHLFLGSHEDNMRDMRMKGRRLGERASRAVLTAVNVREIRASTAPARVFADRYGVTRSAIYNVRRRRTWRHVK